MVIAQASSPALVEVQVCSVDAERDAPQQLDGSAGQVCSPERLACFVVLAVPQEPVLPQVLRDEPPARQASLQEPVLPQDGFPAQVLPRLRAVLQVSWAVPPQPVSLPEQAAQLASQQVSPPVRVGLPEQPPQAWAVIPGSRARTPQASRPLPQQHG